MSAQASETNGICVSTMACSDDSDEETSQEEQMITSWNDLSIIERVGLNSLEMSENDVEAAFCQITLAFRSDQYTLKQRLQAEEHARNLAEENVQLELARGRETLEMLKVLCLDSKRNTILQKLELSLDILGGTVQRISNTAEVLGAVHQEARVSRAVELMVAHVENLRRKYERNLSELEEARRQVQLRMAQRQVNNRESPESEENRDNKRLTKQGSLRRRISSSIIINETNEKKKKDSKKRGGKKSSPSPCPSSESSICVIDSSFTDDKTLDPAETVENHSEIDIITPPVEPPVPVVEPPSDPKPEDLLPKAAAESAANASSKNSTSETLRQRHRWRAALSRRKSDRKSPHLNQRTPGDRRGSQGPGTHWLYKSRWALLCLYVSVFICFITVVYYLLIQYDESY